MSQKTKLDIVTKAVEQVNKNTMEMRTPGERWKSSRRSMMSWRKGEPGGRSGQGESFKDSPQMQADLEEKLEKYNMEKEIVRPKSEATIKSSRSST
ncbi:MAG: hypothetical protein ACLURV_06835 [Gallintestinimicrobium sp.]